MMIRRALAADQAEIRRMIYSARLNPLNLDWRHFLVAEQAGRIQGVGQIKPHGDGSRELASLAVLPAYQGQGIGSALVHALLAEASWPLYLTCGGHLAGYYLRFGFRVVQADELPPYFRRLQRMVGAGERLLRLWLGNRPGMTVMRHDGPGHDA